MLINTKELRIMRISKFGQKGATLVEVLGAVLVFMIGIAALLGVFYSSVAMADRAQYSYTAYNIAKNRLESLRAFNFADLSVANETASLVDENGVADPDGKYSRMTTVTTSYNGDPSLTQIDVKVWYIRRGIQSPAPVQVTTVIYQSG